MTVYGILAGGPDLNVPSLSSHISYIDYWVGVDRGAYKLIEKGIRPLITFGDYDSLKPSEHQLLIEAGAELKTYPEEKDETDLELALDWVIEQKPKSCFIFGATGGRLDHEIAAIHLLKKGLHPRVALKMIDQNNILQMVDPGRYVYEKDEYYPYFSLLSITESVEELTVEGVKYPLSNANLKQSVSLGISNEIIGNGAVVTFSDGLLLVIRSRD